MSGPRLHLIVPGSLGQRTGGYLYDARMASGLRTRDWSVEVHELEGRFPGPDARARSALGRALAGLPADARVVVDGLALGAHPGPVEDHAGRLRILALIHHPLADETGLLDGERDRLADLERRALAACGGAVTTSEHTAARLRASGLPPERVRAAPPGTEPAPRAAGPGPEAPPRLLSVGSVVPRKGHDVLVRALSRIRDRPWTCVCAGSLDRASDHARGVRSLATERGLRNRIRFAGECEDDVLARLYHTSSLFVLPTYHEGYGMALAEALARGLPVVSTTAGAVPDTVPSDAGVLVPPGDHRALAGALGRLLPEGSGPAGRDGRTGSAADRRRRELAAAARRHGRRLPDWERAARGFAEALLALTPEEAPA